MHGHFQGAINVLSNSTLDHASGITVLYGALSGEANLAIQGASDFIDHYVGLFGDASQFTGDLRVESGTLRIGSTARLGAGEIHVGEGAQLLLGASQSGSTRSVVPRDIHLTRSSLYASPPMGLVTGDVYVYDWAFLGANTYGTVNNQTVPGLKLEGAVLLDDGATIIGRTHERNLYFLNDVSLIELAGDLQVGAGTVWRMELANVGITGTIRARVPQASIDFQGVASMLDLKAATIVAEAGRTLTITVNGAPAALNLATPDAGLSGEGALAGAFNLSNGATVAPGSSPGKLSITGDVQLGSGAVYQWEFGGSAGSGVGWDLLQVEGALALTATPETPWIFRIENVPNLLATGASEWLIASATTVTGFDPAAVQIVLAGAGASRRVRSPLPSRYNSAAPIFIS